MSLKEKVYAHFRRRCRLKKKFTHGGQTKTDHNSSGELKTAYGVKG